MEKIVLIVHLITALAIIGIILIQQGKGAEAGASFGGGASQTVFGSAGGWNFFTKVTALLATVFFVTSFTLAVLAKEKAKVGDDLLPELETVKEAVSDIPGAEGASSEVSDIPDAVSEQQTEEAQKAVEDALQKGIDKLEAEAKTTGDAVDDVPVVADQKAPEQPVK